MKRTFFHILLCLLLVLSMAPAAYAATLDTTDLKIEGNTITIGDDQNEILEALHAQGKTAKLAVPYEDPGTDVYVLKDDTLIVAHDFEKEGFIRFETPGSGVYVITEGSLPTLGGQLEEEKKDIPLLQDEELTDEFHAADGTVIDANGHSIKSADEVGNITAEGSLVIEDINDVEEIIMGAGDRIDFTGDGTVKIVPAQDVEAGYGSVQVTTLNSKGKAVTRTYFLVEGETLKITPKGKVTGNQTFPAAADDAKHPPYKIEYASHDNTHVKGSADKITAKCNGLYEYYTEITLQKKNSSTIEILAQRTEDGESITSGIEVSEGSTVLTMKSKYLNGLSVGEYDLTFHYADGGSASGKLLVKEKSSKPDETNPKTGDIILMPALVMTISIAAAAVLLEKKKRA